MRRKDYEEYLSYIRDLMKNPDVRGMGSFVQHGDTSTLKHAMNVSLMSYRICRRFGFDDRSAARGGLLHDFYLYDWHRESPENHNHAFSHPSTALRNACARFQLNPVEKSVIAGHMWPLTIWRIPKNPETFVVLTADKLCAMWETVAKHRRTWR